MKRYLLMPAVAALILAGGCAPQGNQASKPAEAAAPPAQAIPYGSNKAASGTFVHDGVTLYYETYGEGPPLLMVHGNGASIGSMAAQIDHFKAHRKVIAMDSRDQGRSGDSVGPITYEKMADDLAALLDHLQAGPTDVVGWSDGGIEALLLGIRHPEKVKKLVAMAANLSPGLEAIYPETDKLAREMTAQGAVAAKTSPQAAREYKVTSLLLSEPHIAPALLGKIAAPTLVLSSDHDLIRLEHTLKIYESLPNANLAVFPNATHFVPYDDPALFNATVERFLDTPFKPKDRIADVMASMEKMTAAAAAAAK